MHKKVISFMVMAAIALSWQGCVEQPKTLAEMEKERPGIAPGGDTLQAVSQELVDERLAIYAPFTLTTDLSHLVEQEKEMVSILFDVADIMNDLFWMQALGDRNAFLDRIPDENTREFAKINYGPWDRLNGNKPFIEGAGPKPKGANFYPVDMTKEEFEALDNPDKTSLYTLLRRDENDSLIVVWYHEAYADELAKAAGLMRQAAELTTNEELKNYLFMRADALVTDDYQPSDFAWMDMKNSKIDFVVGAIENYEDGLYGYKAAFESFILVKDQEWSDRLAKYAAMLPDLQKGLPVEEEYKQEIPGTDADLNAYDVIYYAGDCNAGSKTIAINLPNDEEVQLQKGSRKLQLKNAMRAKFDKILVPISEMLIDPAQRGHVTFNAFFSNTMFHEVAHAMGVKNTINDQGPVRKALKEQYSAIEEGKADIMGLYLVRELYKKGEIAEGDLMDYYVTFFAGIFRSSRFGAASAHGKANMMRFNFFTDEGAFTRNDDGTYTVNMDKMDSAMEKLMQKIIYIQGDGDYEAAKAWVEEQGRIMTQLQQDLDRLNEANIPVDIVFNQGKGKVGLQ